MTIDERIQGVVVAWINSARPFVEDTDGSEETTVYLYAVVEIFLRIIRLNRFEDWGRMEKAINQTFRDTLHTGIENISRPFN